MARARNIKPGFFKNDALADCGAVCMVAFAGLWTIADFQGNLEYRPRRIKLDTIPYFDTSIEECIDTLEKAGFVHRYHIDTKEYLHIRHFDTHQNPHKNERGSGTLIPVPLKDGIDTEQVPSSDGSARADSLNLIPDSLNPIGDIVSIPESIPEEELSEPSEDDQPEDDEQDPEPEPALNLFDEFWEHYPRKTNKLKAQSAWAKVKNKTEVLPLITENIRARLATGDWELSKKGVIPHPSTYLNGERWEDEVITKEQSYAANKPTSAVERVTQATGQQPFCIDSATNWGDGYGISEQGDQEILETHD